MENILIINKPLHVTSHDVVDVVRKKTGERRVGHAGTLDPLASGVLIILVGRGATKRQAEFMGQPKEYIAELTFGSVSATYDAEGPLTVAATEDQLMRLKRADIEQALPSFIGVIQQRPPIHSAIKVQGKPLYTKARKGEIQAEAVPFRSVQIDEIEVLDFNEASKSADQPPRVRLRVACQKGTYIRSLAHDIGQQLGVGAYLSGLIRTKIGEYTIENAITLEQL